MKKVWDAIKDYVYIVIAVILIRTFLVTPAIVSGPSMDDTLEDGQLVVINKLIYRVSDIKRFDIVVVNSDTGNEKIIKRVIGLPGETIKYVVASESDGTNKGELYINNELVKEEFLSEEASSKTCIDGTAICHDGITLGEDEYFVMGDNRPVSKDSRSVGTFKKENFVGRVKYRLYPFSKFGKIDK